MYRPESVGFVVRLEQTEQVSVRILGVSQQPDLWDLHLRDTDFPAALLNSVDRFLKRRNGDGIDCARTLPFARTKQPTVDSRFRVFARCDEPIFHRAAFEFLERPSKNVPIKRLHRFGIVGINLKMNRAIHDCFPNISLLLEQSRLD